ncbi:MAG: sugar ABC transporter substrate-binding protein [Deltaproteobacteria bacterium]|nr:MAG: sugar ABC transporter substrate-binding protein [Deltaproteobacteria bacterium]
MLKRVVIFCLVISFLFTLGLGSRDEAFAGAKRYKMVFIVKSMDNPFWNMMLEGAQNTAKDLNLEIKGLAPIKPNNVEEQIRQMEDAITAKMDAIIVVPSDSKGIGPGIEKANRAGIPVMTSNTRAFGGQFIAFAGAPNEEAAYLVAKQYLTLMGGKGNYIILEGVPGAQTAIDRKTGIDRAVKEFPNVKVLASQTAKFSRVEGMRVMENLLQQFPKIDGVICANDEMALGAIEAIDAAKRLKDIKVAGFDGNNDAIKSISEGRLVITGAQRPDAQAYWSVLAAYMHLEGYPVPREIYVPCPPVNKSNVGEYLKRIKK